MIGALPPKPTTLAEDISEWRFLERLIEVARDIGQSSNGRYILVKVKSLYLKCDETKTKFSASPLITLTSFSIYNSPAHRPQVKHCANLSRDVASLRVLCSNISRTRSTASLAFAANDATLSVVHPLAVDTVRSPLTKIFHSLELVPARW